MCCTLRCITIEARTSLVSYYTPWTKAPHIARNKNSTQRWHAILHPCLHSGTGMYWEQGIMTPSSYYLPRVLTITVHCSLCKCITAFILRERTVCGTRCTHCICPSFLCSSIHVFTHHESKDNVSDTKRASRAIYDTSTSASPSRYSVKVNAEDQIYRSRKDRSRSRSR